jgi:clan AA aspartic protease
MGLVYAEVELINAVDLGLAARNYIDKDEVKRTRLTMLVDSGSIMLAINENIQAQLQFEVRGKRRAQLANGDIVECDVVGPVDLRFKNREITCKAIVLPGDSEPLLGMIPLEEMDVLIDPLRQELIVNPAHPDYPLIKLKAQNLFGVVQIF